MDTWPWNEWNWSSQRSTLKRFDNNQSSNPVCGVILGARTLTKRGGVLVSFTYASKCRPHGPNWSVWTMGRGSPEGTREWYLIYILWGSWTQVSVYCVCSVGRTSSVLSPDPLIRSLFSHFRIPKVTATPEFPGCYRRQERILVIRQKNPWLNNSSILGWLCQ